MNLRTFDITSDRVKKIWGCLGDYWTQRFPDPLTGHSLFEPGQTFT